MWRPVGYREYACGPELSDIIECFWTTPNSTSVTDRILPDGCMDLVFDFSASAAVVGAMRLPRKVPGGKGLLGVRFRPGGLQTCLAHNASELTDRHIDLTLLWPQARSLWNRLGEASPSARVAVLSSELRALRHSTPDALVRHCVRQIEASGGALRMDALVRQTGCDARRIQRRFAAHIGLSAKRFARIVRFRRVVKALSGGQTDWAAVAVDCGYSDQPHLIREFKELSGQTPGEVTRTVANLQDEARHRK